MRSFCLLLSLFCVLALSACGTEDETIPPTFSDITMRNSSDLDEVLTNPFVNSEITITGNIDDFSATIVANSTVTGEVPVNVNSSDGSWSFPFVLQDGANVITFTASDKNGNLNQLILNLFYATPSPINAGDSIAE